MASFVFTKHAEKKFLALHDEVKTRVIKKLQLLKSHPNIFTVLIRLRDFEPATHRLRVGSHRLILELKNDGSDSPEFLVLDLGHRKEIYK